MLCESCTIYEINRRAWCHSCAKPYLRSGAAGFIMGAGAGIGSIILGGVLVGIGLPLFLGVVPLALWIVNKIVGGGAKVAVTIKKPGDSERLN